MLRKTISTILILILTQIFCIIPSFAWTVSPVRFEIDAEKGKEYTFAFSVLNENQLREIRFDTMAEDWIIGAGNAFTVLNESNRAQNPNLKSAASWIKITPQQFVIAPGQVRKVRFTVKVPDDATLSGDYTTTILVGEKNIEKPPKGERQVFIKQTAVVAVIIYISIGEKTKEVSLKGIDFTSRSLGGEANEVTIIPSYENKGNSHGRGKLTLKMKPLFYPEIMNENLPENAVKLLPEGELKKELDAGEVVVLRESSRSNPIPIEQPLPTGSEWEFELIGDFGKNHPLVIGKKTYKIPVPEVKPAIKQEDKNETKKVQPVKNGVEKIKDVSRPGLIIKKNK